MENMAVVGFITKTHLLTDSLTYLLLLTYLLTCILGQSQNILGWHDGHGHSHGNDWHRGWDHHDHHHHHDCKCC
jgi:hypothetical protein